MVLVQGWEGAGRHTEGVCRCGDHSLDGRQHLGGNRNRLVDRQLMPPTDQAVELGRDLRGQRDHGSS